MTECLALWVGRHVGAVGGQSANMPGVQSRVKRVLCEK